MPPTSVSAPSSESSALTLATIAPDGTDPNVTAMINGDILKLKDRTSGFRRTLHTKYGLVERDMNDISVSARCGLDQEAFDALLKAYNEKQEREQPQQPQIH